MVSIAGLEKTAVVRALWNHSRGQGLSLIHEQAPTDEQIEAGLKADRGYLDYFMGRVFKVDLSGDEFDPYLYDRDNGPGAAEWAIGSIRG